MNGNETDVDCGGSDCPRCHNKDGCKVDEDCVSNFCASGQCAPWSMMWESGTSISLSAVALDSSGNIFVTGWFSGELMKLNPKGTVNSNAEDIFLAKLDPKGNVLEERHFGSANNDRGVALAVDSQENVYLAAQCNNTDFGGGPVPDIGAHDVCVAKFNNNLGLKWAKSFGTNTNDTIEDMALLDGAMYLSGYFIKSGFSCGNLQTIGTEEAFVVKLDSDGNCDWAKSFGSTGKERGLGVVVDPASLFLVGKYNGPGEFAGMPFVPPANAQDGFLLKLKNDKSVAWSLALGGDTDDVATAVAINTDHVFVAGQVNSDNVIWGDGPITNAHTFDGYVARFDRASGGFVDKVLLGSTGKSQPKQVVEANDVAFVAGFFDGTNSDFGGKPLSATDSGADVFVATLDATKPQMVVDDAVSFGGTGDDKALAMAVNPSTGNVVIVGTFTDSINFGNGMALASGTGGHVFVASLGKKFITPE